VGIGISLDHVDILVRDWEGVIEQYKAILGIDRVTINDGPPERGFKLAHFELDNGTSINIVTPTDEHGPWARHLAKHGDGIYLFSLGVDDLEGTAAEMRDRGVRLPPPFGGLRVVHPASAGGALIHLGQRRRPAAPPSDPTEAPRG
jgi:methylmalonyl-CoA/ethylmalonyl-CoA epimerase